METTRSRPPLVFLGGTFDPPHVGHCLLARDVLEAIGAERLFFVPAAQNPHKPEAPRASGEQRLAMLERAVACDPQLGVLDLEIRRAGPSYTVDTVRALCQRYPGEPLAWVVGADQLAALPRWREPEALAAEVEFLVLARPGATLAPPERELPGLRWRQVGTRQLDISATEVRARLAAGKPVDFFLPKGVLEYIRRHQLYSL